MKLTGKCLESFLDYYWKNYIGKTRFLNQKSETEEFFNSLYPTFQNALIIEFFNSVKIWNKLFYDYYENGLGNYFEATNAAILKANDIYNENK